MNRSGICEQVGGGGGSNIKKKFTWGNHHIGASYYDIQNSIINIIGKTQT